MLNHRPVLVASGLVTAAAYLTAASLFLPWFTTPQHGPWTLTNYHFLLKEGVAGFFVIPPLATFLLLSVFALLGPSKLARGLVAKFFGVLITLLGALGCFLVVSANGQIFHLFFNNIIVANNGPAYYLSVFAHAFVLLAGLSLLRGSFLLSRSSVSTKNSNNTLPTQQQQQKQHGHSSSSTTLRQRKKQQQQQQQKRTDENRNASSSSSSVGWRVIAAVQLVIFLVFFVGAAKVFIPSFPASDVLQHVHLPPGFKAHLYAKDIPNARSMATGPKGTLFVGTRTLGKVYAILDRNQDYVPDEVKVIEEGLYMPNGVAFKDGALYLAEVDKIWRYDNIESSLLEGKPLQKTLLRDNLPNDSHHGWKFIRFGPDGLLYVPVGAPCNVCERDDPRYATIMTIDVSVPYPGDNNSDTIFAYGIRNSVGFDWHPITQHLWFTENGRDFASEEYPPDELNHAPKRGLHFGYPYCFGYNVHDPETNPEENKKVECSLPAYQPSAKDLDPHVAALGVRFYQADMFPSAYKNVIFFAEHGSWNRKNPTGYRLLISRIPSVDYSVNNSNNDNERPTYEEFATGFIDSKDGTVYGRPVDVHILPDGSMLVSDDFAGQIYRITYSSS
ncbi:Sorbosone dehydrogenase [Balamuthia mandrillaris]